MEVQKKLKYFNINTQQTLPIENGNIKPSILVKDPNPHMPLIDAICTRRTARAYDRNNPVSFDTFKWIIHHSMHAPSSCNEQKWKVLLIKDKSLITELYERGSASFLKNSNQCFLLCYSNESDNNEWSDSIQSGAAFINTFSLLAHSIGVGTCWIGHLPNKSEVKRMFGMHKMYDPVALVSFGYYLSNLNMKSRKKNVDEIISLNKFKSVNLSFDNSRNTLVRSVLRYMYYKVPFFLRKKVKKYALRYEKKFYYENYD